MTEDKQKAIEAAWRKHIDESPVGSEFSYYECFADGYDAGYAAGLAAGPQWVKIDGPESLPKDAGLYWFTYEQQEPDGNTRYGVIYHAVGLGFPFPPNAIAYQKVPLPAPFQEAE